MRFAVSIFNYLVTRDGPNQHRLTAQNDDQFKRSDFERLEIAQLLPDQEGQGTIPPVMPRAKKPLSQTHRLRDAADNSSLMAFFTSGGSGRAAEIHLLVCAYSARSVRQCGLRGYFGDLRDGILRLARGAGDE
jgi:hypothetical protein